MAVECMLALWCAACWISCANALPVVAPSMRRMATASVQAIGLSNDRIIDTPYLRVLKGIITGPAGRCQIQNPSSFLSRHRCARYHAGAAAWLKRDLSVAFMYASSPVIFFSLRYFWITSSMSCIPWFLPPWMTFRMLVVLPSRMELDSAEFDSRISLQAIRPLPFAVRSRIWAQTPLSESASMDRIWGCCADGNTSMIRSTVLTAELVCKVPKTNDPIVAAVTASEMVS